jgi:hypothetical protein
MKILADVEIASGPRDIFSWINNPDKAMRWQKGVKSPKVINNTIERIGTTFIEELEENGKSLIINGVITDYIQDRLISFQLESKIHSVLVTYSVVGNINKTVVSVYAAIKWKFPMNIISLIIGHKIKSHILRQTQSELSELKKLCETESYYSKSKRP